MRILFLCEQYPPVVWDGVGSYTHDIAPALTGLGHEVHVLCCQGRRIVDEVDEGVHVHRRPLLRLPVSRYLGRFGRLVTSPDHPRDSLSLRASLAVSYAWWFSRLGLEPDVVETNDGETRALLLNARRRFPLVINHHTPTMYDVRLRPGGLSARGRAADRLDRVSSDRADAATAPSQLIVDALRAEGWLRDRAVTVIPNPLDARRWSSVPDVATTEQVVLAVGRLEWRKGVDTLLDAVDALAETHPDSQLLLVGRPSGSMGGEPMATWLERRLARLRVPHEHREQVEPALLGGWYAQARVVAVASRFESYSIVAAEALAAGRPVVASTRTGIAPLIAQEDCGALFPPEDSERLRAELVALLDAPYLAAERGHRGRAAVEAMLDPHLVALRREEVYRAAVRDHALRASAPG